MFNVAHVRKESLVIALRKAMHVYKIRRVLKDEPVTSHEARESIQYLVLSIRAKHPDWDVAQVMPETFERAHVGHNGHILLIGSPKTWGRIVLHLAPEGEFAPEITTLAQFILQEAAGRNREINEYYDACCVQAA